MTAMSTVQLARAFAEIADTLVDDFDLVEFLQMVTRRASELSESHAAGLLLADPNQRLQFMAASDEQVHLVELFQLQVDEGPCQDCYRFGHPVVTEDLTRALARWPRFAPYAVDAGIRSVHAFPLRLRQEVIGTMGLFNTARGGLARTDAEVLQSLADVATIGILQERAIRHGEAVTEQLQRALGTRILIEQAKGVIAQSYDISVDEAFELLRTYCRGHGLRLRETAQLIVRDPAAVPDLRARRAD